MEENVGCLLFQPSVLPPLQPLQINRTWYNRTAVAHRARLSRHVRLRGRGGAARRAAPAGPARRGRARHRDGHRRGLIRDALLGATPAAALADDRYLIVCLCGAALAAAAAPTLSRILPVIQIADAVGLGVFAAMGAAKGAAFGLGPVGVALMGGLTATGGGAVRDVLVREVPSVLRHDLYATAALVGGACYAAATAFGVSSGTSLLAAASVATGLRLLAIWRKLALPRPGLDEPAPL